MKNIAVSAIPFKGAPLQKLYSCTALKESRYRFAMPLALAKPNLVHLIFGFRKQNFKFELFPATRIEEVIKNLLQFNFGTW